MMRFLVVGCGGSGGHTMAYLMDQLRSDLSKDGIQKLPAAWQFVFLDVPLGIQSGPEGVGNVLEQKQGAQYIGMGPQGGSYPMLDFALSEQLRANRGLGAFGSWASRRPREEETAVDVGAGQYRAIGRAILLANANRVRETLRESFLRLSHADTISEMETVARATGQKFDQGTTPIVLVISSMAGGAGASMALDVCRLLTYIKEVNANLIALFMLAPDVFDTLPQQARSGVRANALAMLGEIVASQTGAAKRHDVEMLTAVGVADKADARVPFARVFPVGRSVGRSGAVFGNGSREVVYRGLARGLAGLMTSQVASEQFVAFDLGNKGYTPANQRHYGWGADPAPLPWGSFGFASISMGRDRYAEYAAQRIARSCVDRLVDGHLAPPSATGQAQQPGSEQVKALVEREWPMVCQTLHLPSTLSGQGAAAALRTWYTGEAVPRRDVEASTTQIVEQVLNVDSPYVTQATHWLEHVQRGLQERKPAAMQRADEVAYATAVRWQFALVEHTEVAVADGIARHGLVYAGEVLDHLREFLVGALIPGTEAMGKTPTGDLAQLPPQVVTVIQAAGNGQIAGGNDLIRAVLNDARAKLGGQIYAGAARHISLALGDFVNGFLAPLRTAIDNANQTLRAEKAAEAVKDGLARLETNQYAAWPSENDTRVPDRFGEANNELMLTPSGEFGRQFVADISTCLPPQERGPKPLTVVTTQIISGLWTTTGKPAPGNLLIREANWWPRAFRASPESGHAVTSQDAAFTIAVRPEELRQRAALFVERPNTSFADFCALSLRDYVAGTKDHASGLDLAQRRADLVMKFRRALGLAMPLISVDGQAVKVLHTGEEVKYAYKFSDVPLKALPGQPVEDELRAVMVNDQNIHPSSVTNFNDALKDSGNPRRIDIFGAYPLYSPLAFDSILDAVVEQWEATLPEGVGEFWNMRRARPLDASLPMSTPERRAMIAGWLVGQIVGEIKRPPEPYVDPVRIWDPAARNWVDFPSPLLTPPSQFRSKHDWLPAVLESILLALARAHRGEPMSSLKPYHLLRDLYDSEALGGREEGVGLMAKAAERKLATWLQKGSLSGSPSQLAALANAKTPEERYRAASEWLTGPAGPGELARRYRPAGLNEGNAPPVDTRVQASRVALFSDIAQDMVWATNELDALLLRASRATSQDAVSEEDGPRPDIPEIDEF